jgi:malate dehydrogenase (oxaloacetate-decarboxylating)
MTTDANLASPNAEPERFPQDDVAPSYVLTLRVQLENRPGTFARLAAAIANFDGNLGAVDIVGFEGQKIIRDINVLVADEEHGQRLVEGVRELPGIHLINVSDQVFHMHLGGKIHLTSKYPINNRSVLSQVYTPGVSRVCAAIARDPRKAQALTIKRGSVAIVTDGSALLNLGDVGPLAAIPLMEGKAMLFKEFADIDAWPVCLDARDVDRFVETVKAIAPVYGAINLEDIAAPRCFEIERRLRDELEIPVFHDDQHGAAIVALAALRNALRVVKKPLEEARVVISGAGAAGQAVARILSRAGARHIVACDSRGALCLDRAAEPDLTDAKRWLIENTNPDGRSGSLSDALENADVFIGLSAGHIIGEAELRRMDSDAIVFALASPQPEVMPEVAWKVAKIVATSRSDYPNQVNNVLVFPGIFRGALDAHAREINEDMMLAAADALSEVVRPSELCPDYIVPSVFNPATTKQVARAVAAAALKSGAGRRHPPTHF